MKYTKKDYIYITILIFSFIILIFNFTKCDFFYGSKLDWYSQHVAIPEYFRTLFYDTKNLLPNFALNIGAGQNIYNLSYYGLLSPIILLSYLFPKVSMINYIVISTIILVLISGVLIYKFLRKHQFSEEVSFISSLCFLLSAPLIFHSHRHIMFINYMPFLILGLYGVDKKFNENKSWLLILSIFLMIMTSYYYSVGGIVCILIYALYIYLVNNKVTFKSFFKTLLSMLIPIAVAILLSSIILLPTLLAIFSNRLDSNTVVNLKKLLIPNIKNFNNLLYRAYSLGLPTVVVPALINFLKKDKANITLGVILIGLFSINVYNYLLNGFMYIDSKSLIPFLPLYTYVIAVFFKDLFDKKINLKVFIPILFIVSFCIIIGYRSKALYLLSYHYTSELIVIILLMIIYYLLPPKIFNHDTLRKYIIIIPLFALLLIDANYLSNQDDKLAKKDILNSEAIIKDNLKYITDRDDEFYRISIDINTTLNPNKTFENPKYYNATIYSSISDGDYNNFYHNITSNNMTARNRALVVENSNIIDLLLMGKKYIISYDDAIQGYKLIKNKDNLKTYQNDSVLPLGFATSNIMNYKDYERLNHFEAQEALLNVIVTNNKSTSSFMSNVYKTDINLKEILINHNAREQADNSILLQFKTNTSIKHTLPYEYRNKILFIKFNVNNDYKKDRIITINGEKNTITNINWKYYNNNKTFEWTLSREKQDELNIEFTKGIYLLSDFEIYAVDYEYLNQATKKADKLIVDAKNTKGDIIKGSIDVQKNGYFMLTIPYHKGFTIKVDKRVVDYEKVDYSFIGFPIKKGKHIIEISYVSPGKRISIVMTLAGIISYIVIIIIENKKHIA